MNKKILCIGGANVDFKMKSHNSLILKTSNPVFSNTSFGGVARNVAHNLAKITSNVFLQTVVGDDDQGKALLGQMQALGVNTQHCQLLKGKRTSQYHAILNDQGELFIGLADMNIYDELSDHFITDSWDHWNQDTLVFLDTNLPASNIDLILKKSRSLNIQVCIDLVSVEKTKKMPAVLDSIFLIKADIQEASELTKTTIHSIDDCMTAGRMLRERGVTNSVISLGNLGYVITNDTYEIHVPAEEVEEVVDVSGAGDAFIAGILFGLQQEKDVLSACEIGAKAAARTIQSLDSVL